MIHLSLTGAQQRELAGVSRQAIGRVALRAHMVLLAGRGYSVPQIATIHACGTDVVRTWLHRYAQQGVAGLADQPRSGRPPKDQLAGPIVDAQASQSPRCSGHVQACWSVALLAAFLARRFCLVLARSSVRRSLHRMGWRWARPRLAPAGKPDPEAEVKRAALAQAARAAAQGLAHRLSLDESELHRLPLVRAMGMKGRRVRIAPSLQDPDRRIESGAHRRLALAARLEPDRKSHRLLRHLAVRSGDLLGARLDPQRGFGKARDRVQCLAVQRSLKAVASLLPAIGDHPDVKVVADAVGLGACGNERVERLVEDIRQKGGLALSAF